MTKVRIYHLLHEELFNSRILEDCIGYNLKVIDNDKNKILIV